MTALKRLAAAILLVLILLLAGAWWIDSYGAEQRAAGYTAGHAAAVAAGKAQYDRDTAAARKTESDLRAQLRTKDTDALKREEEYHANLETAQHRVRAGADRLRCPTAGPVPAAAAPDDRPAAGGPAPDGQGTELVPDVAAALLGDGAAIAGIVRKFDRLEQRFEACRALNPE